jgi:hypothetical protein
MAINVVVDKGSRPTLMSAFHPAWHAAANRTATKTRLSIAEPYPRVAALTIRAEPVGRIKTMVFAVPREFEKIKMTLSVMRVR